MSVFTGDDTEIGQDAGRRRGEEGRELDREEAGREEEKGGFLAGQLLR